MSTILEMLKFVVGRRPEEPCAWSCWTVDDFPNGENTPTELVYETLERFHNCDAAASIVYEMFMETYHEVCSEYGYE